MFFSTAWLTTNRTCNNRCDWCYAKNTLNSCNIMDFEKAKIAVSELKRRNVKRIILIGGEPTIYPYFIELIQYIKESGIYVSVATNGRKFKDVSFAKQVLDAGIDHIDISLKAFTESEYKKNTGTYGLSEMICGYKNLKSLGFAPTISYVIVNDDHNSFNDLISFLLKENMSHVSLQFVKPVLKLDHIEHIMDLKSMGNFVEYIYSAMSRSNINYSIEISFPLCLIKKEILSSLIREDRIFNCCHVPRGSGINIDENFKIIPCNHFAEFPFSDEPIDFSNPKFLDSLYESSIVKSFRQKARCYPSVKCKSCDLWNICGGGCFTYWLTFDPNDYIF